MKPGVYRNMPAEDYHAIQALSKSGMDLLRDSPATLKDYYDYGLHEPTPAMALGTAVHCRVLEPQAFEDRYVTIPDWNKNTKKYKEWAAEQEASGKMLISTDDMQWCEAIARRVNANPTWRKLLEHETWIEPSLFWERDGILCKARPDAVFPELGIVADLKTTRYGVAGFAREIVSRRYYVQAAWYIHGLLHAADLDCTAFLFVAAHKSRPFLVSLHEMLRESDEYEVAIRECGRMFDIYAECVRTDTWPGYADEPFRVAFPDYLYDVEEDENDGDEREDW